VVKKQKQQLLDENLFRQEMAGVVPLKTAAKTDSKKPRTKPHTHKTEYFSALSGSTSLTASDDLNDINAEDGSSHRKNGIQKRTMQKLRKGRFTLGAELDLHSMTREIAHPVLLQFIADANSRSLESVRIIHGKGLRSENGPRLKIMTRQVLQDHPRVLAYTQCKPADGGSGAVDVLLKSS